MQNFNQLRQFGKAVSKLRSNLLFAVAMVALMTATVVVLHHSETSPVLAQSVSTDGIWQRIYQQLPDLPQENQYVNKESRKVDPTNTLVGRLIRYHLYVKGRSPLYRLDWKVTLADYLGVNESIVEETYPSNTTLSEKPQEADIAAVRQLNRAQRAALVDALVKAFAMPVRPRAIVPPTQ